MVKGEGVRHSLSVVARIKCYVIIIILCCLSSTFCFPLTCESLEQSINELHEASTDGLAQIAYRSGHADCCKDALICKRLHEIFDLILKIRQEIGCLCTKFSCFNPNEICDKCALLRNPLDDLVKQVDRIIRDLRKHDNDICSKIGKLERNAAVRSDELCTKLSELENIFDEEAIVRLYSSLSNELQQETERICITISQIARDISLFVQEQFLNQTTDLAGQVQKAMAELSKAQRLLAESGRAVSVQISKMHIEISTVLHERFIRINDLTLNEHLAFCSQLNCAAVELMHQIQSSFSDEQLAVALGADELCEKIESFIKTVNRKNNGLCADISSFETHIHAEKNELLRSIQVFQVQFIGLLFSIIPEIDCDISDKFATLCEDISTLKGDLRVCFARSFMRLDNALVRRADVICQKMNETLSEIRCLIVEAFTQLTGLFLTRSGKLCSKIMALETRVSTQSCRGLSELAKIEGFVENTLAQKASNLLALQANGASELSNQLGKAQAVLINELCSKLYALETNLTVKTDVLIGKIFKMSATIGALVSKRFAALKCAKAMRQSALCEQILNGAAALNEEALVGVDNMGREIAIQSINLLCVKIAEAEMELLALISEEFARATSCFTGLFNEICMQLLKAGAVIDAAFDDLFVQLAVFNLTFGAILATFTAKFASQAATIIATDVLITVKFAAIIFELTMKGFPP